MCGWCCLQPCYVSSCRLGRLFRALSLTRGGPFFWFQFRVDGSSSILRSTTSDDVGVALADRLNPTSRRATLQPPLAYCVTAFGRLFVRSTRDKVRVSYEAAARPLRHRAICSARHDSS